MSFAAEKMTPRHIHILGASGSGTTTLGQALASQLGCPHLDTDSFFWLPTDPPFQVKREREERQRLLMKELTCRPQWVLSGSLCGWGDLAIPLFTHVVFLWLPTEVRLARLRQREQQRFQEAVQPGGSLFGAHWRFLEWAAGYDTGDESMRSRQLHETWLAALPCPVVRVERDLPVKESARIVIRYMETSSSQTAAMVNTGEHA